MNALEHPIIFSGAMVRSILAGDKTQTRRLIDCPPDTSEVYWAQNEKTVPAGYHTGWVVKCGAPFLLPRECPFGGFGHRLWVRERIERAPAGTVCYAADGLQLPTVPWAWKRRLIPSIHMPRELSRITLEVMEVRAQRLRDITPEDAMAEGVTKRGKKHFCMDWSPVGEISQGVTDAAGQPVRWTESGIANDNPVGAFLTFFERISNIDAHTSNPWVWAVTFRRV